MRYDAIVLGLGGMGSAALAHLAARGKRVVGFERFSPAHAMGSSHGDSRMIRRPQPLDGRYVPLVLRAYELWRELEAATGATLLRITGGLFLGRPQTSIVSGAVNSVREHGIPHENFILGPHPLHPQVILAGAFSGHGYKFCGVVGEIIADLITRGSTPHPIALFDPRRYGAWETGKKKKTLFF
ncbi:MAG TPA: FAD-dependent oxidoreductase [Candidatus Baltobacteraceae bacterium]|nr:FAD-dependent oxidoreductase [Candidatus Baltobacteraceae bacterium]